MGLGKTKLPRKTSILDTGPLGSTGTTVVTRNDNVIGLYISSAQSNPSLQHVTESERGRTWALATPEATMPTPTSETNLTDTLALGLDALRS